MRNKKFFNIYCSLLFFIVFFTFFGRRITNFLRSKNLLKLSVYSSFIFIFMLAFILIIKKSFKIKIYNKKLLLPLLIIGTIILLMFFHSKTPEEKVHIFEYGLLGFLSEKIFERKSLKYKLIIFFTLIFGILEEVIQKYLPSRIFDPKDILLNEISISFGIILSLIIKETK